MVGADYLNLTATCFIADKKIQGEAFGEDIVACGEIFTVDAGKFLRWEPVMPGRTAASNHRVHAL